MNTFYYTTCALLMLASMVSSQGIGCYVEGDCSGGPLVGFSTEEDSVACHVVCLDTASCAYWTYYQDDGTCLLYSQICDLGNEDSTISGEVITNYVFVFYFKE